MHPPDQDAEIETLYRKLDEVILPMFYEDPDAFDRVRRGAVALNGGHFSTRRMMLQYATEAYGLHMDLIGPESPRWSRGPEQVAVERES
jgi:hypothetical protein